MPKHLSKSDLLQLKLKGKKFDDGSPLELDDEDGEDRMHDVVVDVLAELSKQTGQIIVALSELNKIVGQSLVSLSEIVEKQSKSISALADGVAKITNKPDPIRKPRSYVFDVRREDGRIKQITAKEVEK